MMGEKVSPKLLAAVARTCGRSGVGKILVLALGAASSLPGAATPSISGELHGAAPLQVPSAIQAHLDRGAIKLPPGFHIAIYAVAPGARQMAMSPKGTLFVGNGGFPHPGKSVYAFQDRDGDGYAEERFTLISDGDMPNGLAFAHESGDLYVAERFRITVLRNVEAQLAAPRKRELVFDAFPSEGSLPPYAMDGARNTLRVRSHADKFLALGRDDKLYVEVAAPCNICAPDSHPSAHQRFHRIFRLNQDGSSLAIVAEGVRQSGGCDWHPQTGELWFTDEGRTGLGPGKAPGELNRLSRVGQHFGYPCFHGSDASLDPDVGKLSLCDEVGASWQKPALELPHESSPLGLRFYTGMQFPPAYRHQLFLAEQRTAQGREPAIQGSLISLIRTDGAEVFSRQIFAEGWTSRAKEAAWGRLVDLLVAPDGSLLVSDDKAGVIYRISYRGP